MAHAHIRRINRCSIGVALQESWTKECPAHPRKAPEPDPLTIEYLVDDCLTFLLKKGAYLVDPNPIEFFKSFHPSEHVVEIIVPLYSVKDNVEDYFPKDHPKNEGKSQARIRRVLSNIFQAVNCRILASLFRENEECWRWRNTSAAQRTRKPTEKKRYMEAMQSAKRTGLGKRKSISSRQSPVPSRPISDQDEGLVGVTGGGLEWKSLRYLFHMEVGDGMVARYIVECLDAPPGKDVETGTVSLTWMHEPGTC
ncbi:hypothetical protein AYL99_10499 [Fonsecaea erecta]|uniref:Uncharacterized protein n=1 Tax=Fonsecaea erecta TaxID=1367422 RepID=A0A178Z7X1_9EURO|nr:hypothetical protein AYL99_10499 [Fonsecaea erecta]OAP55526.1 hypothetical protein AYL99_10499 [Fonsecaea erecta]